MLITKFNKLIRNKILWGVFAFIIAFAFVGASALSSARRTGGCGRQQPASGAGVLYGETVSEREFGLARLFELGMRQNVPIPEEMQEILRNNAWRRLVLVKTASRLGLSTTQGEVGEAIRRDPTFAVDGRFHEGQYDMILRDRLGITRQVFDLYVEQELTLRKVLALVGDTAWISPLEMQRRLQDFTDQFIVHYSLLERDEAKVSPDVDDETVKEFFETNPELFRLPERMSVRYVAFPSSNYLAKAVVTDEQIEAYYDDHTELHPTNLTNDVTAPIPVAVRQEILDSLQLREAALLAKDEATDLAVALAPGRTAGVPFDLAATQRDLAIHTTGLFSAGGAIPGIDDGSAFSDAAFELDPDDPAGYFSDAVMGEDAAYILAFGEKLEPSDPEFDAVAEQAREMAGRAAAEAAFAERASDLRSGISEAMAKGSTFADAAESADLNVITTALFSVAQGVSSNHEAYAFEIMRNALRMDAGDVSEPVATTNGVLLVHVLQRVQGDIVSLDAQMMRPYLQNQISEQYVELLRQGWAEQLLKDAGFEDFQDSADSPEDTDGI